MTEQMSIFFHTKRNSLYDSSHDTLIKLTVLLALVEKNIIEIKPMNNIDYIK